jgi:hypothetical protein
MPSISFTITFSDGRANATFRLYRSEQNTTLTSSSMRISRVRTSGSEVIGFSENFIFEPKMSKLSFSRSKKPACPHLFQLCAQFAFVESRSTCRSGSQACQQSAWSWPAAPFPPAVPPNAHLSRSLSGQIPPLVDCFYESRFHDCPDS